MILLTSTSDIIRVTTSAATALDVQASWLDNNAGTVTPGRTNTIISSAATTTIVGSPGASQQRTIASLSIRATGGAQTVTVEHYDGTSAPKLVSLPLGAGESVCYEDGIGWYALSAAGTPITGNVSGLMRMINVKDYGAKGDGATDDTAAVQAAISGALASGVSARGVGVFFPAGVYKTTSVLNLVGTNCYLVGEGNGASVIYPSGFTTTDVLRIGNGATSTASVGMTGIAIIGAASFTAGAFINVNLASDVMIRDFNLTNAFTGVLIQGASIKVHVRQGVISALHAADGLGISVVNGAAGDTYITDVIITNAPASKPAVGIQITQSGHFSILRCNVTSCIKGLHMNPSTSQDVSYGFVGHTLFDSCGTHGLHINPGAAASARVRSMMFMDCWFSGSTTTGAASQGIEIGGGAASIVDSLSFIGCRVLSNQRVGVNITYAGAVGISFTDCTISGNSAETTNTYNGVEIPANGNSISFSNCKIGATSIAAAVQKYAINVAAGTSAGLQFIGNDCQPNGTLGNVGYIQLGAITGGGNMIENNTPSAPSNFGTARQAATGTINATATLVSDATAWRNRLSANAIQAGTSFRARVWGTCTVATAASTFAVSWRLGTNNSTADSAPAEWTGQTSGAVGTAIFSFETVLTCRVPGASATWHATLIMQNGSATLGLLPAVAYMPNAIPTLITSISTANANYLNLSMTGSTNVSIIVHGCTIDQVLP